MIRREKETLIGINLSTVHSSFWQQPHRCRGAQLPLGHCVLLCSHPALAPITAEYPVTLLKGSLGSTKNPNARDVLNPPGKLGMQY